MSDRAWAFVLLPVMLLALPLGLALAVWNRARGEGWTLTPWDSSVWGRSRDRRPAVRG